MLAFFLMALLAAAEPAPAGATEDPASKALAKRDFPWFDAQKQAFRPLQPPAESERPDHERPGNIPRVDAGAGLSLVARVCLFLVLAIVVGWLAYLLYLSLESAPAEPELKPVAPALDPAKLESLPAGVRNVTDFLAEARRLLQESDFNLAMVFYFSWQLVTLNQEGVIELEVGKTNRRYLSETSQNRPAVLQLFVQSTRLFEEAFYGGVTLDRERFLDVWKLRDDFLKRPQTPGRRP